MVAAEIERYGVNSYFAKIQEISGEMGSPESSDLEMGEEEEENEKEKEDGEE